jgi:hypothetical protein
MIKVISADRVVSTASAGLLVAWSLVAEADAYAGERIGKTQAGTWVREEPFTQAHVFCFQTWTCVPGKPIIHSANTSIVTTSSKVVRGVCNAAGGPADSCNFCASNAPSDRCEWWLEKK